VTARPDPWSAVAALVEMAGISGPDGQPMLGGRALAVVAVGWATVELDRAEGEMALTGSALDVEAHPDRPDELLGARARFLPAAPGGIPLVLLEPSNEGRLAAALARHGEGPTVLYLGPLDPADGPDLLDRLAASGVRIRTGASALGPAGLVVGRPLDGPQLVLVAVPSGA